MSFIPDNLDQKLKNKILKCALQRYKTNPNLHDKVEFEVIPTCYTSDNMKWFDIYVENGPISETEFQNWMYQLKLTTKLQISNIEKYIDMSMKFDREFDLVKRSDLSQSLKIKKVLFLLQDLGTISFAHLARCGFIAVSLLNALAKTNPEYDELIHNFQLNVKTISSRLSNDILKVRNSEIDREDFLEIYGHLRPSTYDIYSSSYRDSFEYLIMSGAVCSERTSTVNNKICNYTFLNDICNELGEVSAETLAKFIENGIKWREESKFIFSKGLSYVLDSLKEIDPLGLYKAGTIKHLGIGELLSLLDNDLSKEACLNLVNHRSATSLIDKKIELPQVISNSVDFEYFFVGSNEINFIGTEAIIAPLRNLSSFTDTKLNLSGCIALIESADPGYDWLFSHHISGLITQYGGANSHMAIRAVEYNIPAAIGVGELHRKRIEDYHMVELDCVNKILRGVTCE